MKYQDGIPASVSKAHNLAIAKILLDIFNEVISTGQYPDALKVARVVPVFKSGDTYHTIPISIAHQVRVP